MYEIEDSLEEFDIRYMEACNQVTNKPQVIGTAGRASGSHKIRIDRSDSITTQTKKLTLSSPLLANKELPNFTCYAQGTENKLSKTRPNSSSSSSSSAAPLTIPMTTSASTTFIANTNYGNTNSISRTSSISTTTSVAGTLSSGVNNIPVSKLSSGVRIYNDFEVSPTDKSPATYTMRPPLKPSVTISSIETLSKPKFKSQSLNSSPSAQRRQTTSSSSITTTTTTTINSHPVFRRRATYTQPSSNSSSINSIPSSSHASSIGNPFYKPLVHKKDTQTPNTNGLHLSASATSLQDSESIASFFEVDYLADMSIHKKRKISSQESLNTLSDSLFEDNEFADYLTQHSLHDNTTPFDKSLNDYFNILEDGTHLT